MKLLKTGENGYSAELAFFDAGARYVGHHAISLNTDPRSYKLEIEVPPDIHEKYAFNNGESSRLTVGGYLRSDDEDGGVYTVIFIGKNAKQRAEE